MWSVKETLKYRGKEITIEQTEEATIVSTDKIFRKRAGTGKEVIEILLADVKEVIDVERNLNK